MSSWETNPSRPVDRRAGVTEHEDSKERMKEAGKHTASAIRDRARHTVDNGKASAVAAVSDTSHALDRTAENLSAEGKETLAEAASAMSHKLSDLAGYFETRSFDEIAHDARDLARRKPAVFIVGGIAAGLMLSRFFRASGDGHDHHDALSTDDNPYGDLAATERGGRHDYH